MSEHAPLVLSPVEARILGVLVEKQFATPDAYPLTANALANGCNQKTSRDPVMNLSDTEVQTTLDELRGRGLVLVTYGASGRVMRYAQALDKTLKASRPLVSLLAVLMLRGPQTPGELRINCDRLYHFPDISSLEAYVDELAEWSAGPMVVKLPKQPGSREHRYAHLLSGEPDLSGMSSGGRSGSDDVGALRAEVIELRRLVDHLYAELGVAEPRETAES